jgi:hypothetical protein
VNDTQLLNRLGRANAYVDDAPLPEAIWTHDLALREIDRRIGMQTQEKTTPVAAPEPRRRGWLVAAAAFGVVLLVGVVFTLANRSTEVSPATPPTTVAPPTTQAAPATTVAPAATTVAPAALSTIEVEAYDYEFRGLPSQLSVGDALELVNRSTVEYHNLVVFAVLPDDTRSLDEFAAMSPEELELELRGIGHLDAAPGEAAFNGRIRLQTAGRYLALDMTREGADPAVVERLVNPPDPATADSPPWLADGGSVGYQHGMITEFTVVDR